jgi:hypothetical protein
MVMRRLLVRWIVRRLRWPYECALCRLMRPSHHRHGRIVLVIELMRLLVTAADRSAERLYGRRSGSWNIGEQWPGEVPPRFAEEVPLERLT